MQNPLKRKKQAFDILQTAQDLAALARAGGRFQPPPGKDYGHLRKRKTGSGEDFWQYRSYDPGDSAALVDWRQSGKSDHLYVRQKQKEERARLVIWSNQSAGMRFSSTPGLPQKAQLAAALALALGIYAHQDGHNIRAAGHQNVSGRTWMNALYDDLCHDAPLSLENLHKNDTLFIFSDFLEDPETIEALLTSLPCNFTAVQILDPAEIDFPFTGAAQFSDMGGTQKIQTPEARSLRDDYKHRFQDHQDRLAELIKRYGGDLYIHRSDLPPEQLFFALIGGRL